MAESKIISAQADVEAAKMMRESADILNSSAAVYYLYKYYMCDIKIVFLI